MNHSRLSDVYHRFGLDYDHFRACISLPTIEKTFRRDTFTNQVVIYFDRISSSGMAI